MNELALTAPAVAAGAGTSRQSVYLWLRGETKALKGETLLKLARTLRTTPEWLLSGKGAIDSIPGPHDQGGLSAEAVEIAGAWDALPEFKRRLYRDAILHDAAAAEVFPEISGTVAAKSSYHAMIERFRRDRATLERQLKLKLEE